MPVKIKICGLTSIEAVNVSIKNKVDYIGCVFYKYSPRNITAEYAAFITQDLPNRIKKIALVSYHHSNIKEVLKYFKPDILQFHADDSPEEIVEIKSKFKLPIIKTIRVSTIEDLKVIDLYADVADMYLFESICGNPLSIDKPGRTFDWGLLKKFKINKPWFLSGSLDKYNVNYAIRVSGAKLINASVTLESSPGIKDANMVEGFINSIRNPNY